MSKDKPRPSSEAHTLMREIVAKGIKQHFAPEILAYAEALYKEYSSTFEDARQWSELTGIGRVAWCRLAIAIRDGYLRPDLWQVSIGAQPVSP